MNVLFRTVFAVSISAGAVALLLLAVRALFIDKAKPWVLMLLWGVLLARLLVPFTPQSQLSIFRFAPQSVQNMAAVPALRQSVPAAQQPLLPDVQANAAAEISGLQPAVSDALRQSAMDHEPAQDPSQDVKRMVPQGDIWQWAGYLWLGGMGVLFAYMLGVNLLFEMKLRRNRPYHSVAFADIFAMAKLRAGMRRRRDIPAIAMDRMGSPAVHGVLRPRILIPFKYFDSLSQEQQEHVLCHELMHIRHGDTLWVCLGLFLASVHWFNPVLWAALYCFRRDLELLCDLRTVHVMGGRAGHYADTLITVAQKLRGRQGAGLIVAAMDKKNDLKWRIRMIVRQARRSVPLSVCAVALVLACALVSCTAAPALSVSEPAASTATPLPASFPTPSPAGTEADGLKEDEAQAMLADLYFTLWNSLYTLQSPQMPDNMAQTAQNVLNVRWTDYRIHLIQTIDSDERLYAPPRVEVHVGQMHTDAGGVKAAYTADIAFERGDTVPGNSIDAVAVFANIDGRWMMTDAGEAWIGSAYEKTLAELGAGSTAEDAALLVDNRIYGGGVLPEETAADLCRTFFYDMWSCLGTLQEPQQPDYALDNANIALYKGWVRYRIAQIEHPYNAGARLNAPPKVEAAVSGMQMTGDDLCTMDYSVFIHQDRNDGVNGMLQTGTITFARMGDAKQGEPWMIEAVTITAGGYSEYAAFAKQMAAMENPTVKNVERMIDSAIAYFRENS